MYVTPDELKSHLYNDDIEMITQGNEAPLIQALEAAQTFAEGYLEAYDTDSIFSATYGARDALLMTYIKDIAVWHFVNLCNVGSDLQLRQNRYDDAVKWLEDVQIGKFKPKFPVAAVESTDEDTPDTAAIITYGSNPKRQQHI